MALIPDEQPDHLPERLQEEDVDSLPLRTKVAIHTDLFFSFSGAIYAFELGYNGNAAAAIGSGAVAIYASARLLGTVLSVRSPEANNPQLPE